MALEATGTVSTEVPDKVRDYVATRDRVEGYFDGTATKVWERLTSDAPVSRIRETVRAGRDEMRELILSRLPQDMSGQRVLDAGCGPGQMSLELARRGADVVGVDISPQLIDIARKRLPREYNSKVQFYACDMFDPKLGTFDHAVAMDSLIYYTQADIATVLQRLEHRVKKTVVFTVAPRTPLLMAMWYAGKLFPRSDRSPTMIPHNRNRLASELRIQGVTRMLRPVKRVARGFYISEAMELRA